MEDTQQPDRDPHKQDLLVLQPIDDELQKSYLDYAMSVIIGRALPDVRDGLKPVHRRILYAMQDLGLPYTKAHKKCARIVGEVLGKYHPHGDQSVYDALVRMGQDFSLRTPLVDGQGNFGSLDGDPPAAMRYTEARLAKVSQEMLQDIEKETVDFVENFDGSLEEPSVLPAKLPNLLANGSSGIAVGMATNIPPHNITELSKAICAYMDDPEIEIFDLASIMPGPDFPTGGVIQGHTGIRQYYSSGRGKLRVRAVIENEKKGNRERLIITQIPYMVNKSDLVQEIANNVKSKKIEGISDIVDESDRQGMRVVIDLKQGGTPEIVENQLYHHTRCQTTFGVNMVCIVDGRPRTLGVKEVFEEYIKHRRQIVRRRTEYDLRKAKDKEHLLEGLVIALDNIDAIVEFLKKTKDTNTARTGLQERYDLTEKQANAILEMRLSKLTGLEQEKLRTDLEETRRLIKRLEEILASERRMLDIIKGELEEIAQTYADGRRTAIVEGGDIDIDLEDLIEPEDVVITISNEGYCKRLPVDTYRAQHRGGKGIIGAKMKDGDFVRHMLLANTHQWILVFTDQGKVYWTKGYNIPEGSRTSKGRPIINVVNIDAQERVRALIPVKEFSEDRFLLFATRKGLLKKTPLSDYQNVRSTGIIAINLQEGDNLMDVLLTNGENTIFLASAKGQAVRCSEGDVRPMGRNSMGVKGITLAPDDQMMEALVLRPDSTVLTITENGYGKRTRPEEYRLIKRGGKGVINILTSERNGDVVSVRAVSEGQDLVVISKNGIAIRTPIEQISVIGRSTQGVKIMNLKDDDRVVTCVVVDDDDDDKEQDTQSI